MTQGTIITFYSYKGGVGRTLALANVAALLSLWGNRVLCLDWDLEAPGLHLYFQQWTQQQASQQPGLTELLQSHTDGENPDWKESVSEVLLPESKTPLHLISAGRQDETYVQRMQLIDWRSLYENHQLGNFLETLRNDWKQAYDFILIDSRTGITDIGGICTVQLPDLICLLFTANSQSLYGAVDVVERAMQVRANLPFDRNRLWVLPVVTRFEARIEYELAQQWLDRFDKALAPLYEEWAYREVTASDLLNFTKIPYVPYWSFGEKIPVIEEGTKDPDSMGFALETVAAMLAQNLALSNVLINNRDAFVATAKRKSLKADVSFFEQKRRGVKLFLSSSKHDEPFRNQLVQHLSILRRSKLIQSWQERQIDVSDEWNGQVNEHIETADLILFLLSADFLASDYCWDFEVERALERHESGQARVIPIILRPVDWHGSPFSKLPVLPTEGKPVSIWSNQDKAFAEVSQDIRIIAEEIIRERDGIASY